MAWETTFSERLSNESLGKPPSAGPNAFSDEEREQCEQSRCFFSAGGASRVASPPRALKGGEAAPKQPASISAHLSAHLLSADQL